MTSILDVLSSDDDMGPISTSEVSLTNPLLSMRARAQSQNEAPVNEPENNELSFEPTLSTDIDVVEDANTEIVDEIIQEPITEPVDEFAHTDLVSENVVSSSDLESDTIVPESDIVITEHTIKSANTPDIITTSPIDDIAPLEDDVVSEQDDDTIIDEEKEVIEQDENVSEEEVVFELPQMDYVVIRNFIVDNPSSPLSVLLQRIASHEDIPVLSINCHIPLSVMPALCAGVANNLSITALVFNECGIGDEHVHILVDSIFGVDRIQEISLPNNSITDHGLVHLAQLKTLRYLCLENNRIVGRTLVPALHNDFNSLLYLDLHGNYVRDAAGKKFVNWMKKTQNIESRRIFYVDVSNNRLSSSIYTHVLKYLFSIRMEFPCLDMHYPPLPKQLNATTHLNWTVPMLTDRLFPTFLQRLRKLDSKLERVMLNRNGLTDVSAYQLSCFLMKFPIEELALYANRFSETGVRLLSKLGGYMLSKSDFTLKKKVPKKTISDAHFAPKSHLARFLVQNPDSPLTKTARSIQKGSSEVVYMGDDLKSTDLMLFNEAFEDKCIRRLVLVHNNIEDMDILGRVLPETLEVLVLVSQSFKCGLNEFIESVMKLKRLERIYIIGCDIPYRISPAIDHRVMLDLFKHESLSVIWLERYAPDQGELSDLLNAAPHLTHVYCETPILTECLSMDHGLFNINNIPNKEIPDLFRIMHPLHNITDMIDRPLEDIVRLDGINDMAFCSFVEVLKTRIARGETPSAVHVFGSSLTRKSLKALQYICATVEEVHIRIASVHDITLLFSRNMNFLKRLALTKCGAGRFSDVGLKLFNESVIDTLVLDDNIISDSVFERIFTNAPPSLQELHVARNSLSDAVVDLVKDPEMAHIMTRLSYNFVSPHKRGVEGFYAPEFKGTLFSVVGEGDSYSLLRSQFEKGGLWRIDGSEHHTIDINHAWYLAVLGSVSHINTGIEIVNLNMEDRTIIAFVVRVLQLISSDIQRITICNVDLTSVWKEVLHYLGTCNNLYSLSMKHCCVTDKMCAELLGAVPHTIQNINFEGNYMTEDIFNIVVSELTIKPSLQWFQHPVDEVQMNLIPILISKFASSTHSRVSELLLTCNVRPVSTIDLSNHILDPLELNLLTGMESTKYITDFRLARCELGDEGCNILTSALLRGAFPRLQTLNLSENSIGEIALQNFTNAVKSTFKKGLHKIQTCIISHNEGSYAIKNDLKYGIIV
ncbi:hypothetical protein PCE1_001612 [Barthelona sp. PCE]